MVSELLKTKVYWSWSNYEELRLVKTGLKTLREDTKEEFKDIDPDVFNCPSYTNEIKYTWVVRTLFDIDYQIEGKDWLGTVKGKRFFKCPNPIQIQPFCITMLSEDMNTDLTVTPPFLHRNTFAGMTATFNIGRWFRAAMPTIIVKDKKSFTMKAGSPLMYLKFKKPVELIEFKMNNAIQSFESNCINFKLYEPHKDLDYCYNKFDPIKKDLLKEVRSNLIND